MSKAPTIDVLSEIHLNLSIPHLPLPPSSSYPSPLPIHPFSNSPPHFSGAAPLSLYPLTPNLQPPSSSTNPITSFLQADRPDPAPRLSYSMGISLIGEPSPKKETRTDFGMKIGMLKEIKMKITSKLTKKLLKIEKFIINPIDLATSRNFDKLLRRISIIDPSKVKYFIIRDLQHRFLIQLWKEIELRIRNWANLEALKFHCTLLEK